MNVQQSQRQLGMISRYSLIGGFALLAVVSGTRSASAAEWTILGAGLTQCRDYLAVSEAVERGTANWKQIALKGAIDGWITGFFSGLNNAGSGNITKQYSNLELLHFVLFACAKDEGTHNIGDTVNAIIPDIVKPRRAK